jgi:hypothetical protein
MGVNLRRLDSSMSEELLEHSQISPSRMHVGRKSMTQNMRGNSLWACQSGGNGSLLDLEESRLSCQSLGAVADRVCPFGKKSTGEHAAQRCKVE